MEFLHDDVWTDSVEAAFGEGLSSGSQQVEVPLVDPSIFIERSLADY